MFNYYIQGQANSGTATYTATAPGFSAGQGSITLAPLGIVIVGPGCSACTFQKVDGPKDLTVFTALLDANFNPVQPGTLAGGSPLVEP